MVHSLFSYFNFVLISHYHFVDVLSYQFSTISATNINLFCSPSFFSFYAAIPKSLGQGIQKGLIGLGAGSATAGCLGAGIGQGFSAGKACEAIGRNPEAMDKVRTIMIIGAAIAESGAIYSLLVAIILLFVF